MPDELPDAGALLDAMSEAVYVVDRQRVITYWNPAAEALTGFSAAEVIGRRCRDGILNHVDSSGHSLCGAHCPLLATMRTGQPMEVTAYLHHHDGHRVPVAVRAAALRNSEGKVTGAVEVFHDDTRCRSLGDSYREAVELSLTDPLTELGNRRMLQRALRRYQDEFDRYGRVYAVLFADVDHFKSVNDRIGHDAGDEVLRMVANTMGGCTRPTDVLGRWGGEEFLLLAPVEGAEGAHALAERVRLLVASSWVLQGQHRVRVTLSIGVAVAGRGESAEGLVERADLAMLRAKEAGRDRVEAG